MKLCHHGAVPALEKVRFVRAQGQSAKDLAAENGKSNEKLSIHDEGGREDALFERNFN